jgi:GTPase SAR1 family protein
LIGNKCDLQSTRAVTLEDAKLLAKDYGMEYLETSAAEDFNIDNAFRMMAKMVLERKSHGENGQIGDTIAGNPNPNQKNKKCC